MNETAILLQQVRDGDKVAANELFSLLYDEMRSIASRKMAKEQPGQTLQGTALVNEVYERLIGKSSNPLDVNSRNHFLAYAARVMQQILVEIARKKASEKHGAGWKRVTFHGRDVSSSDKSVDIAAVSEALESLEEVDPRAAEIFRFKFFCQMTAEEIAAVLDISESTVNRDWVMAKAFLAEQMTDKSED